MLAHWIWLATRPAVHDRDKVALLRHFQDPEEIFFADRGSFSEMEGMTEEALDALQDRDLGPAEEILNQCREKNIQILTYRDAAYSGRLRNISDPPLVFYYKGRLPDFDGSPLIGVVGTRSASPYGLGVAKRMGYQIAKCGGVVVSGMAFGIDAMAMRGALTADAPAVGILGCGVDIVYPVSNRSLFADTEHYGCIMSEFPPGTPPMKHHFPKRNRIISGLSCGVLVVEAPERSGALITAHQAADQGRDVFVVPGNIDVDSCIGSNRLLRDGAIAVSSGWDVMSEYQAQFPDKIGRNDAPSRQAFYADELPHVEKKELAKVAQPTDIPKEKKQLKTEPVKKPIDKDRNRPYIDLNKEKWNLTRDEQAVVAVLQPGERLVDDVIAEAGIPAGAVLATLTMLEVKGVVRRLPGRHVTLK